MIHKSALLLLVIVALLIAACGGGGGGGGVTLSETYNANGVSFRYPGGWVIDSDSPTSVSIASTQATLDALDAGSAADLSLTAGQYAITVLPFSGDELQVMSVTDPKSLLTMMAVGITGGESLGFKFGEVAEATINGNPGARVNGASDKIDVQIVAVNMGTSGYAVVFAMAPKGDMGALNNTLNPLLDTLSLTMASG